MNRPHNNETRLGFAADSTTGLGVEEDVADRSPGATSFVIFDLETTGLCPESCEIIQIAVTRFRTGEDAFLLLQNGDQQLALAA